MNSSHATNECLAPFRRPPCKQKPNAAMAILPSGTILARRAHLSATALMKPSKDLGFRLGSHVIKTGFHAGSWADHMIKA